MTYPSKDIQARWQAIEGIAGGILTHVGKEFTATPNIHIQTDIAAVGSLSGLMILQETVQNLREYAMTPSKPGNVLLSEVYEGQNDVFRFVTGMALGHHIKWDSAADGKISTSNQPLFTCEVMTKKLASLFYAFCKKYKLEREYYKFAAAMAGFIVVDVGTEKKLVDPIVAKNILFYYVVAGSKTIPYPEALW